MPKHISYIEDFESWISDFKFFISVRVRFSETDLFGHVNNTVPFIYFEQARIEFLKSVNVLFDLTHAEPQYVPVVADLQCDFLKEMFFNDDLKVYVKAARIGTSSVDLHYLITREDDICATGRGTLVKINKQTGKSAPWTDEERERLQKG